MGDCDPREMTKDEMLRDFMQHILFTARYWANLPGDKSIQERCNSVALSILSALDGCNELPVYSLVPSPHPTDKDFRKNEGINWYPECPEDIKKLAINSNIELHALFSKLRNGTD